MLPMARMSAGPGVVRYAIETDLFGGDVDHDGVEGADEKKGEEGVEQVAAFWDAGWSYVGLLRKEVIALNARDVKGDVAPGDIEPLKLGAGHAGDIMGIEDRAAVTSDGLQGVRRVFGRAWFGLPHRLR